MTPPAPATPLLPDDFDSPEWLEEVRRATRVLERIADDRTVLAAVPDEERATFLSAAGRIAMVKRDERTRLAKHILNKQKRKRRAEDRELLASAEIRQLREAPVFVAPTKRLAEPSVSSPSSTSSGAQPDRGPERVLQTPRRCYVCKGEYRTLHFFYDSMCTDCGEFNYGKRFPTANLTGKVALITGGRVKIGFNASLMLLRAGARVIVTTRFPNDAALRYAREPDFADWSHRVHLHGLDLRHAPSVEIFAQHIEQTHERLDILINNAAQTVRRPPGFYSHLLGVESKDVAALPPECQPLLADHHALVEKMQPLLAAATHADPKSGKAEALTTSWRSTDAALGIHSSALLSQIPYAFENDSEDKHHFPEAMLDADLQQVDLRTVNSWRLTLSEVNTAEMLEVHLVNAVAPFILCGKLKPLMMRDRKEPGHIVNVSAMEGIFSRGTKTEKHPHTNMAKAALNMMTLTAARDYIQSNLYMNAVDTGWVTDEDPAIHAQRKVEELGFQPPLDIVDGAARIVDPVFHAAATGEVFSGLFFKDYKPANW